MKSWPYLSTLVLATALTFVGCGDEGGGFSGVNNTGGGAGGGGAGGGGGSGGIGVTPDLAHQVPPGAALLGAKLSSDARLVAYRSDQNLNAANPAGATQIFLLERGLDMSVQVTTADNSNVIADGVFDTTDDGTEILFSSTQDLDNQNATNSQNLFVASDSGQTISQVTDNVSVNTFTEWQIAGDGSYAVFGTEINLLGTNPDLDVELYRVNIDTSVLTQITSDVANPENIRLADDSERLVYTSTGDPLGTNADMNQELFVINADGSDHRQLTETLDNATDIVGPEIADAGTRVVFVSNRDFVGTNVDATYEVFVIDVATRDITQITDTDRDSGVFIGNSPGDVDISGSGEWVVFGSTFNFTGENPTNGHTIFFARTDGSEVSQPLREGTVDAAAASFEAENVSLNDDGSIVLFDSLENFSIDSTGGDRKLFTQTRLQPTSSAPQP